MSHRLLLSWGYWFSSRSLGLLEHPYITMRAIVRERFMRPLVALPLVLWGMGWVVGEIIVRVGSMIGPEGAWVWWVKQTLLFGFVWGTLFLLLWQVVLLYLYGRFKQALSE